jgi:peroxiredoxin
MEDCCPLQCGESARSSVVGSLSHSAYMKWRSLEESNPGIDTRTLCEQLAERRELIAKYVPPDTQAVHARAIAELQRQRVLDRVLPVGTKCTPFELTDHNGNAVSSSEELGRGHLVICFFRGRWCPFCVGQLEAMNRIVPEIKKAAATLMAISPQTVQQSFFMADQHKLGFPLLSDRGNHVARRFGLVYRVAEYQQEVYRRAFINLPFANGDESWELPVPATFVVDRDETILYASADPDYTTRPEPMKILERLAS